MSRPSSPSLFHTERLFPALLSSLSPLVERPLCCSSSNPLDSFQVQKSLGVSLCDEAHSSLLARAVSWQVSIWWSFTSQQQIPPLRGRSLNWIVKHKPTWRPSDKNSSKTPVFLFRHLIASFSANLTDVLPVCRKSRLDYMNGLLRGKCSSQHSLYFFRV